MQYCPASSEQCRLDTELENFICHCVQSNFDGHFGHATNTARTRRMTKRCHCGWVASGRRVGAAEPLHSCRLLPLLCANDCCMARDRANPARMTRRLNAGPKIDVRDRLWENVLQVSKCNLAAEIQIFLKLIHLHLRRQERRAPCAGGVS